MLFLADPLSWVIPNANRGMSRNSPWTSSSPRNPSEYVRILRLTNTKWGPAHATSSLLSRRLAIIVVAIKSQLQSRSHLGQRHNVLPSENINCTSQHSETYTPETGASSEVFIAGPFVRLIRFMSALTANGVPKESPKNMRLVVFSRTLFVDSRAVSRFRT